MEHKDKAIIERQVRSEVHAGPRVRSRRSGQSLVEAMVAVSLLVTGFLGLVSLLSRSFFLSRVVSDQTTATYLASEGIELAKNLIDHDVYEAPSNPTFFWGSCFGPSAQVELDYTTTDCKTGLVNFVDGGRPLMFDPVSHMYSYSTVGTIPTSFTREIDVSQSGDQITVDSIVRWNSGTVVDQSLKLEDVFYNWVP